MNDQVVYADSINSERSVAQNVISAVAAAEDTSPLNLPALAEVLDPDALDGVYHSARSPGARIEFEYAGYTVVVNGEGLIELLEADA